MTPEGASPGSGCSHRGYLCHLSGAAMAPQTVAPKCTRRRCRRPGPSSDPFQRARLWRPTPDALGDAAPPAIL